MGVTTTLWLVLSVRCALFPSNGFSSRHWPIDLVEVRLHSLQNHRWLLTYWHYWHLTLINDQNFSSTGMGLWHCHCCHCCFRFATHNEKWSLRRREADCSRERATYKRVESPGSTHDWFWRKCCTACMLHRPYAMLREITRVSCEKKTCAEKTLKIQAWGPSALKRLHLVEFVQSKAFNDP